MNGQRRLVAMLEVVLSSRACGKLQKQTALPMGAKLIFGTFNTVMLSCSHCVLERVPTTCILFVLNWFKFSSDSSLMFEAERLMYGQREFPPAGSFPKMFTMTRAGLGQCKGWEPNEPSLPPSWILLGRKLQLRAGARNPTQVL